MAVGDAGEGNESEPDDPRLDDFVAPYIYFASRLDATIVRVSPSIEQVLGFAPRSLCGRRLVSIFCPDCPLNLDDSAFRRMELRDGETVHALRSIRDRAGNRRILSLQSTGISRTAGGLAIGHHNLAEDVTTSITAYADTVTRLNELSSVVRRLSEQELQVAEQICRGKLNREIADDLEISERTVDRRRATLLDRLGVASAAEMVAMLVERNTLNRCVGAFREAAWYQARNAHRVIEALR